MLIFFVAVQSGEGPFFVAALLKRLFTYVVFIMGDKSIFRHLTNRTMGLMPVDRHQTLQTTKFK